MKLVLKVTDHPTVEARECEKCGCKIWPESALEAHIERHKLTETSIVPSRNVRLNWGARLHRGSGPS